MDKFDKDEFFKRYVGFDELMELAKDVPPGSASAFPMEYPRADAMAKVLSKA